MGDYSPHQKKIIERYYDNRDGIMLAKLGDIVSELYLAETDAKLNRLWGRADKAMQALKVPEKLRQHILDGKQPDVLARNLRTWLDQANG